MKKRTKPQLMTKGYKEFYREMYLGSPHFDEMRHHFPDVAANLAYYAYTHGYKRGWASHTNRQRSKAQTAHRGRVDTLEGE